MTAGGATPQGDLDTVDRNISRIRSALDGLAEGLGLPAADPGPRAPDAVATVVVVGEPKNGKSSLVNALVGRPGLSPVDHAVATATYIAVRHGPPGARVHPDGADAPVEVHLDELPAWTTVDGLAANPRASSVPRPVEVSLPEPVLERLTIVDTPGVGGFDGAHDRASLAALAGATSLLFCADGSRPLSEPELSFLTDATASIATVTFALTKVDQEPRWRDVLADNRAKVARRAPAFADATWIPVAAPLAERALDPALPESAARLLRERSGLDALVAHLDERVAGKVRLLAAANEVKQLRSAAEGLRAVAATRAELLGDPSEETGGRLRSEQQELDRLASVEDNWRTDLDLNLTTLRAAELNRLDRSIRSVHEVGAPLAKDTSIGTAELAETVNGLLEQESAAVSARILADTDAQIRSIVGEAIESPAFVAAMDVALRSDELVQLRAARDLVAEGRLQPAQTMPLVMSGTSGFMLANFTNLGAAFAGVTSASLAFVPGVGMAVAATATAVLFARRQSKVNERSQWLQVRLAEARTDMQTVIEQRVTTAKTLALRAVREWIRGRQAELRASVAELSAQMHRDADDRRRALAEASQRVDDLDKVVRTCDRYLERLAGAAP